MYNLNLLNNEKINFISDTSKILESNNYNEYTVIITNLRFLILNYPNDSKNSMEDLKCSRNLYYIPKKEIVYEINIDDIIKINIDDIIKINIENNNKIKLYISDYNYILLQDKSLLEYLKKEFKNKF